MAEQTLARPALGLYGGMYMWKCGKCGILYPSDSDGNFNETEIKGHSNLPRRRTRLRPGFVIKGEVMHVNRTGNTAEFMENSNLVVFPKEHDGYNYQHHQMGSAYLLYGNAVMRNIPFVDLVNLTADPVDDETLAGIAAHFSELSGKETSSLGATKKKFLSELESAALHNQPPS